MHDYPSFLLALAGLCACLIAFVPKLKAQSVSLPPGPKGWPLFGNIDAPTQYFWTKFSELAGIYGDMFTLTVFGRRFIVLNTQRLCIEFFEKHHQNYKDRAILEMMTNQVGWDRTTFLLPAGAMWRDHRRSFNKSFGTRSLMQKFHDIQIYETHKFMRDLLREPEKLDSHIQCWAVAMIVKLTYGLDISSEDRLVGIVEGAAAQFSHLSRPGAYLVDALPILRFLPSWFPGGGFKKEAEVSRQTLTDMINVPFELVKTQVNEGTASPSFVSNLLDDEDYDPEREYAVKTSAASILLGGADTTKTQMHGFFLIMLLWPDKQRKAQEEIDRVIGNDRLPDFNDRQRLPYIEAVLKECMRLHTAVPMGGIRVAIDDDTVDGYYIPQGTMIMPNIWQLHHDPELYAEPLEFVPERWLVESPPTDPREVNFGFGRRICPGVHMADASFFIACVMTLALYDILPTEDSPTEFTHGEGGVLDGQPVCHPKPFKCKIVPRSPKTKSLILSLDYET